MDPGETAATRAPPLERWVFGVTLFTIATAILFGGGPTNYRPTTLLLLLATALLIGLLVASRRYRELNKLPTSIKALVLATLITPVVQLVPLPPDVWRNLPGHETPSAIRQWANPEMGWFPLSLDPGATLSATIFMIPALAVFVAAVSLTNNNRRLVVASVGAISFCSILIGLAQLASAGSSFSFYETSHSRFLLGFFANRNHHALFLVLVLCLLLGQVRPKKRGSRSTTALVVATILVVGGAVLGTFSRAGVALYLLVLLTYLVSSTRILLSKVVGFSVLAIGVVGSLIIGLLLKDNPLVLEILGRWGGAGTDPRFEFWPSVWDVTVTFFPFGSGLGTFVPVYSASEPLGLVSPSYLNRAHNEYLEVVMETGAIGAVLLCGAWFATIVAFFRAARRPDASQIRIMLTGMVCLLLHSFVDYPARTQAVALTTGLLLAECACRLNRRVDSVPESHPNEVSA